jgi:hypothetical protein
VAQGDHDNLEILCVEVEENDGVTETSYTRLQEELTTIYLEPDISPI